MKKKPEAQRWQIMDCPDHGQEDCNCGLQKCIVVVPAAALEAAERMRDEFFRDKEDFWARCERQSTLIEERDAEIARLTRELEEAKEYQVAEWRKSDALTLSLRAENAALREVAEAACRWASDDSDSSAAADLMNAVTKWEKDNGR